MVVHCSVEQWFLISVCVYIVLICMTICGAFVVLKDLHLR